MLIHEPQFKLYLASSYLDIIDEYVCTASLHLSRVEVDLSRRLSSREGYSIKSRCVYEYYIARRRYRGREEVDREK